MAHSKQFYISTCRVDKNKKLRLSDLFSLFQDVAGEHGEMLDIGKAKTTDVGRKWIITRYVVKIERLPIYGETVRIYTYPCKNNPCFFYRNYFVKDEQDNIVIKASSIWAILETKTNKIVFNPFKKPLPEESFDFELGIPEKILDDVDNKVGEYRIQYSDLDLNGHANNSRYIEMIQNLHDSDFRNEHEYDSILINYFAELKEKDVVNLYSNNSNPEIIKGVIGDKVSFKAIVTYKK